MNDAAPRWPLLVVAVVAGVLAFWDLGAESLWFDEAWSVELASRDLSVTLSEYVESNREGPPLYFVVLHEWMAVFGQSEAAVRALSALASVITACCLYLLFGRAFGWRVGLASSVLTAALPASVHIAQEARNYSMLTALLCLGLLCTLRFLDRPSVGNALVLTLVNLAALFTHHLAIEGVVVQNLMFLCARDRKPGLWTQWMLSQGLLVVTLLPALLLLPQKEAVASWVPMPNANSLLNALAVFTGGGFIENPFAARDIGLRVSVPSVSACVVGGLFACVGLVAAVRQYRHGSSHARAGALVVLGMISMAILLPLVVSYVAAPAFIPRYYIHGAPFFAMLMMLGASFLMRGGWRFWVASALLFGLALAGTVEELSYRTKDNWREAARLVEDGLQPGDAVVVTDERGLVPFTYYYSGGVEPQAIPGRRGRPLATAADIQEASALVPLAGSLWLVLPWGGSQDGGRNHLWATFESSPRWFERIDGKAFRGDWGGVLVLRYRKRS